MRPVAARTTFPIATMAIFWITVLAFPLWWLLPENGTTQEYLSIVHFSGQHSLRIDFSPWQSRLALSSWSLQHESWGSLLSYMFIHGGYPQALLPALLIGLTHLSVNMLTLLSLGRRVERKIGALYFLCLYLLAGLLGGLLQVLSTPESLILPLVGASAGVIGVVITYCFFFGEQKLLLFFFLPMRAKNVGIVFLALSFLFSLVPLWVHYAPQATNTWIESVPSFVQLFFLRVGHMAHFGGALVGLIFGLAVRPRQRTSQPADVAVLETNQLLHDKLTPLPDFIEDTIESIARSKGNITSKQQHALAELREQKIKHLESSLKSTAETSNSSSKH